MSLSAWLDCCGSVYVNWSPSVTWSLLRGSSTGDVSSTNVIPGKEGGRRGEGREGLRREKGLRTERGRLVLTPVIAIMYDLI